MAEVPVPPPPVPEGASAPQSPATPTPEGVRPNIWEKATDKFAEKPTNNADAASFQRGADLVPPLDLQNPATQAAGEGVALPDINPSQVRMVGGENPWDSAQPIREGRMSVEDAGMFEKPTNNSDRFWEDYAKSSEKYFGHWTEEQRAEAADAIREIMKNAMGVKDTADLSPDARKTFDVYNDWLMGKIKE